MRNLLKITVTLFAFSLAAAQADASGNVAGQLTAQLTLQGGCMVSGAQGSGSGTNFGTLDFGIQPSTFTGVLLATASGGAGGAGPTRIVCSPEVNSMSISVSAGNNAGQGGSVGTGSRAMKLGSSSFLPYEIYSDAGLVTAYSTSSNAVGVVLPGTGAAFDLPIYGRVNKTNAGAMPAGTYTDLLQVTLSW